jgi:hypothetical protein
MGLELGVNLGLEPGFPLLRKLSDSLDSSCIALSSLVFILSSPLEVLPLSSVRP